LSIYIIDLLILVIASVVDGVAGAKAVAANAFKLPSVLLQAHATSK